MWGEMSSRFPGRPGTIDFSNAQNPALAAFTLGAPIGRLLPMSSRSFLVISKPLKGRRSKFSPEKIRAAARRLENALKEGHLEAAYTMIAGGSIYLFRAPSREVLERHLDRHPLGQVSEVSIEEVEEIDFSSSNQDPSES